MAISAKTARAVVQLLIRVVLARGRIAMPVAHSSERRRRRRGKSPEDASPLAAHLAPGRALKLATQESGAAGILGCARLYR